MNILKRFLLTGVLAAGVVVFSMAGVANAQTLSYGNASLDIDAPYQMTNVNATAKSDKSNGNTITLRTAVFATPTDTQREKGFVFALNISLLVNGDDANQATMENFFNDPDFVNDVKNNLQSSLRESGIGVTELNFTSGTFKGMPSKLAMSELSSNGEKDSLVALMLLKGSAIWVVCAFAGDQSTAGRIIDSIQ